MTSEPEKEPNSSLEAINTNVIIRNPMSRAVWENGQITTTSEASFKPQMNLETLSFKVSKVSHEWSKYNLAEANLVFGSEGNFVESPYKAICRTNGKTDPIAIVGKDYVLLPNEEVIRIADSIMPEYGLKLYETEGITQSHFSKSGNAWFGFYFPKDEYNGSAFVKEIVPGDNIKLGVQLRNSIDGTVGFGLDSGSYRGLCWNGSIFDWMSAKQSHYKHTPSLKTIIPTMKTLIESALAEGEHMVMYYRLLAQKTLSQEIAETLSSTYIPKKYLPWDFTDIPTPTESNKDAVTTIPDLKTLSTKLDWTRQDMTHLPQDNMWSIYNHITGAITHNDKTNPQSKNLTYNALNKAMQRAIPLVVA